MPGTRDILISFQAELSCVQRARRLSWLRGVLSSLRVALEIYGAFSSRLAQLPAMVPDGHG